MEKLELKHLAPYLPYNLLFVAEAKTWQLTCISTVQEYPIWAENRWDEDKLTFNPRINVKSTDSGRGFLLSEIKPILRPLSDLTKEIKHNGEKFVPLERLRKEYSGFYFESNPELLIKSKNTSMYISLNWINEFHKLLFEWHFDVFGLIEKGLAININTINQ